MKHNIKIAPRYFIDIKKGIKTFELRVNDRDYKVNDTLTLEEWIPSYGYTGRTIEREVPYILYGGVFGLPDNLCIMSLKEQIIEFERVE